MFAVMIAYLFVFIFKQKTAYEMRISDWSSDVCSSDLVEDVIVRHIALRRLRLVNAFAARDRSVENDLQDPPRLAIAAGELVRVFELFENRTHDLLEFPLILRGEMGYVGTHNAATCMRVRR